MSETADILKARVAHPFTTVHAMPSPSNPRYFRESALVTRPESPPGVLPFSSATLWRLVKSGGFPNPVKLAGRITAWRAADVEDWLRVQEAAEWSDSKRKTPKRSKKSLTA